MLAFPLGIDRVGMWRWLTLSICFICLFLIYHSSFPKLPAIVLKEAYSFLFTVQGKMGLKKRREGTYVVRTLKSKHSSHGTCNIQFITEATLTAVTIF